MVSKPYLAIPQPPRQESRKPPEPPILVMTWGEFKRAVDALITDDGVIASIDWEQQPKLKVKHLSAGIGIVGAQ